MPVEYKGKKYKELYCKNDNCRKLVGYEDIKKGVVIFVCPRCKTISVYDISRGEGQVLVEQLEEGIIEEVKNLENPKGGE